MLLGIFNDCADNNYVSAESFLEWRDENEAKTNFGMLFQDRGVNSFYMELMFSQDPVKDPGPVFPVPGQPPE